MTRRYSRSELRRGEFRRTRLGKGLAAALERALGDLGPLMLGVSLGRLVVLVRAPHLASEPTERQVELATSVAATARTHLAGAGWWGRLLARSAVVVAFESEEARGGCTVLRYAECVVTVEAARALPAGDGRAGAALHA